MSNSNRRAFICGSAGYRDALDAMCNLAPPTHGSQLHDDVRHLAHCVSKLGVRKGQSRSIVQDAFSDAMLRYTRFRDRIDSAPDRWNYLWGIARNCLSTEIRRDIRHNQERVKVSVDDLCEQAQAPEVGGWKETRLASAMTDRKLAYQDLYDVLERFRDKYPFGVERALLYLRGFTGGEAEEIMGCPESTSRDHMQKMMAEIRERYPELKDLLH